jgi:UPF0271 protein
MPLLLNCDLGETEDPACTIEKTVMPLIDMANIACGFHAGNPTTMANTLKIAAQHGVVVGAHPGYRDPQNFGRVSIAHSAEELIALVHAQVAHLDSLATESALDLRYVKPHGALYNDMMANDDIFKTLIEALARYHKPLKLMVLASANSENYRRYAARSGIELIFEAFADRCYSDQGFLLPRSQPRAVHDHQRMLDQVRQLYTEGTVTTNNGHIIPVDAQTVCVHGDNPAAIAALNDIVDILQQGQECK